MKAKLMQYINARFDQLYDWLYESLPDCRVCAFLRGGGYGLVAGCLVTLVALWLV